MDLENVVAYINDFREAEEEPTEESNLIKHARRELAIVKEEPEVVENFIELLKVFGKMGHSGYSAAIYIERLTRLLHFKNLTPLTDNPDEWYFHGPDTSGQEGGVWQSVRNGEAFSTDGGKTYYFLNNRKIRIPTIPAKDNES